MKTRAPAARTHAHACVAAQIRRLRKKKDMSQEELAFRAGLHPNTIRRLETLKYDPKLSTINRIAKVLKVRIRVLVFNA